MNICSFSHLVNISDCYIDMYWFNQGNLNWHILRPVYILSISLEHPILMTKYTNQDGKREVHILNRQVCDSVYYIRWLENSHLWHSISIRLQFHFSPYTLCSQISNFILLKKKKKKTITNCPTKPSHRLNGVSTMFLSPIHIFQIFWHGTFRG